MLTPMDVQRAGWSRIIGRDAKPAVGTPIKFLQGRVDVFPQNARNGGAVPVRVFLLEQADETGAVLRIDQALAGVELGLAVDALAAQDDLPVGDFLEQVTHR